MKNTYQFKDMNMLQHGKSVWKHTQQLIIGNFDNYRLPDWFKENHHFIVNNLHPIKIIKTYTIYHDIGKPLCKSIDDSGKSHYPNHAAISKKAFLAACPNRKLEAKLIGLDMLLHTNSWDNIDSFNLPTQTLATLLIVAFAEIHSNAFATDGLDSTSFKIKYKKLDRIGKKIVARIGKHENTYSYIFVRKDIPKSHIVVQSAHAMFEQVRYAKPDMHPSIIVLEVGDEKDLKDVAQHLVNKDIAFKMFREPMPPYENSITAIATESLDLRRKKMLKNYNLLRMED